MVRYTNFSLLMLSSLNPYKRHKIRIIWSLLRYDVSSLQIYQSTSVSSHKVFLLMLLYCIKLYNIAHHILSHLFMAPCLLIMIVGSRISKCLKTKLLHYTYLSEEWWRKYTTAKQWQSVVTISSHFTTSANSEQTDNSPSGGNVTDETLVDDNRNKVESELHEDDGDDITEFPRAGRVAQVVRQIEQPVDSQQAVVGRLKRAKSMPLV